MLVLITYDVATTSKGGVRRLRRVAKICQNYGVRVQNSVFECVVDSTTFLLLKNQLIEEIDAKEDSLRFYRLGENYQHKVEHVGSKESLDVSKPLII